MTHFPCNVGDDVAVGGERRRLAGDGEAFYQLPGVLDLGALQEGGIDLEPATDHRGEGFDSLDATHRWAGDDPLHVGVAQSVGDAGGLTQTDGVEVALGVGRIGVVAHARGPVPHEVDGHP